LHHLVQRLLRGVALSPLPLHAHGGRAPGLLHVEEQRPALVLRDEEPRRPLLGRDRAGAGDGLVRAALAIALATASAAWAYTPAVDYALECQGCHRADGAGTPGSVPPLKDAVARFLGVAGGREYLARVPGVAQAPLDDTALAAVLNWMLDHFDRAHVPPDF